ncbi:WD40 repeat-like protein [Ascobolus immersus RN42]|uniref:WD40 repeat-like protein n=1 Tax=Ascobolus immersus RN42 TaxID=1160509 RepID=A0A3N4IF86_ASCIM|nr:WD40 repeat-like protein [Ascobolus immersus RN42]
MAWQSPSAQGQDGSGSNNGSVNGGGLQQNGNGQQHAGTEYTLQGVMRFLQTEWHRHERDRNAWEIERADMKARIAKMEGDNRAAKRLQQAYLQRVKMLEVALKQERSKNKSNGVTNGEKEESEKDVTETFTEEQFPSDSIQADVARGKSKAYLEKCIQEITYLLTPTNHPAPQQGQYSNDELQFMQQQARQGLLHPQGPPPSHPPPRPQPPPDYSTGSMHHLQQQDPRHLNDSNQYKQYQSSIAGANPYSDSSDRSNIFNNSSIYSSDMSDNNNPFSNVAALKGSVFDNPSTDNGDNWDFDDSNNNANAKPAGQEKGGDSLGYTGGNAKQHSSRLSVGKGRKGSLSKRERHHNQEEANARTGHAADAKNTQVNDGNFKVRFALRGHLDVIRAVCFTGGGTAAEPEVCTAGDDGVIKRWNIPGTYHGSQTDIDVQSHFTHRGHAGIVTSLAACPTADSDGWVFSGGQDSTIKVWQKGRVDPKATLEGHTDTVWTLCVLPSSSALPVGKPSESVYLASGSADGTVKIWSVTAPVSPFASTRLSLAGRKSKKLEVPEFTEFTYSLLSTIKRGGDGPLPSPTCITPLSITGNNFIVSYDNAEIIVYDTATGEEVVGMLSMETYDGTKATGVNCIVASALPLETGEEGDAATATGSAKGVAGVVYSGHEDKYIRFFDANSGQSSYGMIAHQSPIASLALSPDGKELVSAGHDASLRFWNLETRLCAQEITSHRLLRGEGVCSVVWSSDGRWVVSGGGDGIAKVFSRR